MDSQRGSPGHDGPWASPNRSVRRRTRAPPPPRRTPPRVRPRRPHGPALSGRRRRDEAARALLCPRTPRRRTAQGLPILRCDAALLCPSLAARPRPSSRCRPAALLRSSACPPPPISAAAAWPCVTGAFGVLCSHGGILCHRSLRSPLLEGPLAYEPVRMGSMRMQAGLDAGAGELKLLNERRCRN